MKTQQICACIMRRTIFTKELLLIEYKYGHHCRWRQIDLMSAMGRRHDVDHEAKQSIRTATQSGQEATDRGKTTVHEKGKYSRYKFAWVYGKVRLDVKMVACIMRRTIFTNELLLIECILA
uniref:40S ribosomal protein S21 n=1 Tax=Panagrellus redivivus TaxID=6233 RepID=A0A7E4VLM6_PANRE